MNRRIEASFGGFCCADTVILFCLLGLDFILSCRFEMDGGGLRWSLGEGEERNGTDATVMG